MAAPPVNGAVSPAGLAPRHLWATLQKVKTASVKPHLELADFSEASSCAARKLQYPALLTIIPRSKAVFRTSNCRVCAPLLGVLSQR